MSNAQLCRICAILTAATILFVDASVVAADPPLTVLTFDEPETPFQSVDDLSVQGVTFDFRVNGADSSEAFYNSFGPGSLTHVTDPSLTGDAEGVLTLLFDVPTSILEFGVALSTADPLAPGVSVELFDEELNSIAAVGVDVTPTIDLLGFSEGKFIYSGVPVKQAVVEFLDQSGSFAIDNLTYVVIPEPPSILLSSAFMLALGLMVRLGRNPAMVKWTRSPGLRERW